MCVGVAAAPPSAPGEAATAKYFASIRNHPRVVGFNLVQPEDDPSAVRDFSLQMSMLDYLCGVYPGVKITLHALNPEPLT